MTLGHSIQKVRFAHSATQQGTLLSRGVMWLAHPRVETKVASGGWRLGEQGGGYCSGPSTSDGTAWMATVGCGGRGGTRETPRPEDAATSPCLTLPSSLFAINKNSCGLSPCLLPSSPLSSLPLRAEDNSAFSFTRLLTPCHSFLPPSNMLGSHFYHITHRFVLGAQFYIFLPGVLSFLGTGTS